MALWFWSFIGGLLGTVFMDLMGGFLGRYGISNGLEGLLGRWVLGFPRGHFVIDGHQERLIPPNELEGRVGMLFHFIVGGGVVALGYPLWFSIFGNLPFHNHILGGVVYGAATLLIAWFIQYPPFGFGACGRKAPSDAKPLTATIPMHLIYGLGIGIVVQTALFLRLMPG